MNNFGMCEMCGVNKAVVFIKKNINGVATEKHLCQHCAAIMQQSNLVDQFLGGGSLIAEMLGMSQNEPTTKMRVCKCGTTERDVLENYKFGCSECYNIFSDIADKYVARLGGTTYFPTKSKTAHEKPPTEKKMEKTEREKLEEQLKNAIDKQDYLLANELKLKIDALKSDK